jgi:hypothetical protein
MRMVFAVALAMALGGCATGYGKSGWTGGYTDSPGPGELVEVGFSGNGYITQAKLEIYLLYRSAELAKQRGKPYFRIYHTIKDAIRDQPMLRADATALGGKPYGKVYMLLEDGPVPGALSADAILAQYASEVKGASTTAPAAQGAKP